MKKLRSTIVYNKKIAIRFANCSYYKVLGEDIRNLPSRGKEKAKYSTPRKEKVTKLILHYRTLLQAKAQGTFQVLKGIYNTNMNTVTSNGPPPIHTNIMSLVASIPSLIVAYRKIRKNKGACTLGAMLSFHKTRTLNPLQRRLISSTANSPDKINYSIFKHTSELLKQGKYPWGASRRIYIQKPGQPGKLRPLTIPPFMDRVVQTSILGALEAIYEPWFEKRNISFGFRSRHGVHDAIYALTRRENKGLYMAIEGDIKEAYNNVDREKLIQILSKRIKDRKFISLIRDRLDYQFLDSSTNKYVEEGKGIPQGGIDSPFLWNIYMSEFDDHITQYMDDLMNSLNKKLRGNKDSRSKIVTKQLSRLLTKRRSLKTELKLLQKIRTYEKFNSLLKTPKSNPASLKYYLNKYFKDPQKLINTPKGLISPPENRFNLLKQIRRIGHDQRNLPSSDPNKSHLRFAYVRYADDWIILGNFPRILADKIKTHIKEWLKDNLDAQLAEDKTFITNFAKKNTPAHFLGFEIRSLTTRALKYKMTGNSDKPALVRVSGSEVRAYPDKQRLISRLNMKGFCDKNGKPRPQSWISTLETFALISRFNSVLLGLGNFYYGFVPKSSLNRWIYIIRYCLLKTLAQKYDTNIKNIFSRFGIRSKTGNTIKYTVKNIFDSRQKKVVMEKSWTLLTELSIQKLCLKNNRYEKIKHRFNTLEYDGQILPYYSKDYQNLSIKDDDWVNNLLWVNLRTQANFDFPCSLCGSIKDIQMHHIKHIRKVLYSTIPSDKPYLKVMALRNRKQIPVCRECHMNVIHKGTYSGANLKTLLIPGIHTIKGYDNRLINLEGFLKRSPTPSGSEYYAASLEEKGWKTSLSQNEEQE
jgi:hypothetical protein